MVHGAFHSECCLFMSPFLLLDGHSTNYQPQVIRFTMEHKCVMLCLPPHTTHESQPLDVGVFAPVKVWWSRVCHDFYQQHPGKIITRFNFSSLFSEAWYGAITPANIMGGFQKAGMYPFDPQAIIVAHSPSHDSVEPSRSDFPQLSCASDPGSSDLADDTQEAGSSDLVDDTREAGSSDANDTQEAGSSSSSRAGPSFTEDQQHRF